MGKGDLSERVGEDFGKVELFKKGEPLPSEVLFAQPNSDIPLPSGIHKMIKDTGLPRLPQVKIAGHNYNLVWDEQFIYVDYACDEKLLLGEVGASSVEIGKNVEFWNNFYSGK